MAWLFGSSASRSSRAASSASRRSLDRDARELSRPARTAPQPARETRSEKATPRAGRSESAAKRDGDFSRASKTPPRKHRHVSEEHAECAVCFEALCDAPTAVFVSTEAGSATRRTCAHYHHLSCARSLRAREMRRCPVCRAPFDDALAVPDPRDDPGGWFAAVDANGDGKLSPPEVLEALKAHVPCDWRRLERDVLPSAQSQSRKLCESSRNPSDASAATRAKARGLFAAWDPDGDGFIELREMVAPGGLLEYVTRAFPRSRARKERTKANKGAARRGEGAKKELKEFDAGYETGTKPSGENVRVRGERPGRTFGATSRRDPPALARHPDAWFAHWDEDGSGTLDKQEVTRALVKTLLSSESEASRTRARARRARDRRRTPSDVDVDVCEGASYGRLLTAVAAAREARRVVDAIWPVFCADGSAGVDRAAFLAPDGLAEAIVANTRVGLGPGRARAETRGDGALENASPRRASRRGSRFEHSDIPASSRPASSPARTRSER